MNRKEKYDTSKLKTEFGWETGAYGKSTVNELYPNIGIYCHASAIKPKSDSNTDKNPEYTVTTNDTEVNVHVMNLVGYAFDNAEQPDYKFFKTKYCKSENNDVLVPKDDGHKVKFKTDLIARYRKIWLKACYICKYKHLNILFIYGVGNVNFSRLLPGEWSGESNFYNEIFLPAFGPKTSVEEGSPYKFCNDNRINVENFEFVAFNPVSLNNIPAVLFGNKMNTLNDILFINAWDPWSIIGNGNFADNSLDGYWGRSSNLSVLGWPMTNPELIKDIIGVRDAKESHILSMSELLELSPSKK